MANRGRSLADIAVYIQTIQFWKRSEWNGADIGMMFLCLLSPKNNLWLNSKFGPLMLALPFILKTKATCVFPDNFSAYALDCIIICPKNLDHNYYAVLIYVCYFLRTS